MRDFSVMRDFSDIIQLIILSFFTWSLLAISAVMLIIQMEIVECALTFQSRTLFDFSIFSLYLLSISVASWECDAFIPIDF